MFDLIVSQGRIADRKEGTIEGAYLTSEALRKRYDLKPEYIGEKFPAEIDDWKSSLLQANETLKDISQSVSSSLVAGNRTIVIGNTCSASLASLPIVAKLHPDAVLLWFDAHGDFNIPSTTSSGYLGGMVLSAVCGLWQSGHGAGFNSAQIAVLGIRDVDTPEATLLQQSRVELFPPERCEPDRILDFINGRPIWIHVDWDVMEPGYIPADYAVPNGIIPSKLKSIFKALPGSKILGFELAEFHAQGSKQSKQKSVELVLDTTAPLIENILSLS